LKAVALVVGGARQLPHLDGEISAAHERATVVDLDVGGGRFQHLAGDRLQALAQYRGRELASAAGDHQRTAGEGAPSIRGAIGVTGNDTDLFGCDADLVGDQLRQGRLQPLAMDPLCQHAEPRQLALT
jgi:hypothetical protein